MHNTIVNRFILTIIFEVFSYIYLFLLNQTGQLGSGADGSDGSGEDYVEDESGEGSGMDGSGLDGSSFI